MMDIRFLIIVFSTIGCCIQWIEAASLTAAEQKAAINGSPQLAGTQPLSGTELAQQVMIHRDQS